MLLCIIDLRCIVCVLIKRKIGIDSGQFLKINICFDCKKYWKFVLFAIFKLLIFGHLVNSRNCDPTFDVGSRVTR
jgi:hypothetical protein